MYIQRHRPWYITIGILCEDYRILKVKPGKDQKGWMKDWRPEDAHRDEREIIGKTDWMNLSPYCLSSRGGFSVAYKLCSERERAVKSNWLMDTCR